MSFPEPDYRRTAFIAGVIDARAHLSTVQRGDRPSPRARITTKRVELIQWLSKHTGVTARVADSPYSRRGCSEHCNEPHVHIARQSPYWTVDGTRCVLILDACFPYLVQLKAEAQLIIQNAPEHYLTKRSEVAAELARLGWPAGPHNQLAKNG